MNNGLLGMIGALAATFGLLALAMHLLRRFQPGRSWGSRGVALEVLQRVSVGPKQGVALLRVADRVLVVSITEGQVGLLTELQGGERDTVIAAANRPPDAPAFRLPGFRMPGAVPAIVLVACLSLAPHAFAQATSVRPVLPAGAGAVMSPAVSTRGLSVQPPIPPRVEIRLGEGKDGIQLSGAVGLVVFLGAMTLLPALFLLMTSFTRILIVLHFLRSALGTQTTPPGQLLVAVAVLLTGVVMNPTLQTVHQTALKPYFDGQVSQTEAYQRAIVPFREFMLSNTRAQDLGVFAEMSGVSEQKPAEELPTLTVMSAFVTSELRTAFQMGFVIFLPFVVVDVIVASVLMSMGMFMLPPMMISLPFKLLLFVLADGWTLVVQNLVASFR